MTSRRFLVAPVHISTGYGSSFVKVILCDVIKSVQSMRRVDDDSYASIVYPKLTQKIVLNGADKMSKFSFVSLQVTPYEGEDAQKF